MSNPPAFQLYAADFYMDTLDWTNEELGLYFRLLLIEWVNGPLPLDIKALTKASHTHHKTFNRLWIKVSKKFVNDGHGRLINMRLEETREKQLKYIESQREAGKRGAEKRWKMDSKPNGNPNGVANGIANGEKIALQSSSLSLNSSSSNEEQEKPVFSEKKSGHFSDQIKDENIVETIIDLCRWYEENLNTFNGWQFVQQNCKCHPRALIDVLRVPKYYIENGMVMRKGPWAIVNKILPSKIKNYNANDTIRAHKELTAQMESVAPEIKEIASKLFGG